MGHKVTDRVGKRSPGPVIGTVKSYGISFAREIHSHFKNSRCSFHRCSFEFEIFVLCLLKKMFIKTQHLFKGGIKKISLLKWDQNVEIALISLLINGKGITSV